MKVVDHEEGEAEYAQHTMSVDWRTGIGILAYHGAEVLITLLWLPLALYMLLRGLLKVEERNTLLVGILIICILSTMWHYVSNMLLVEPKAAYYRDIFFYSGVAVFYLVIGLSVRKNVKAYHRVWLWL